MSRIYTHPDSPFTYDQLSDRRVVSFDKIKLTNNELDNAGQVWREREGSRPISKSAFRRPQVILNSMHRYQPRIHLVARQKRGRIDATNVLNECRTTFTFPETAFTAVTAYQNQLVRGAGPGF